MAEPDDAALLARARTAAVAVRTSTSPNPWVGAVLVTAGGATFDGATEPPGGRHAEIVALDAARAAGADPAGATLAVTLEPCSHHGRTGPCAEALAAAGVARVVVGVTDPDPQVAGRGIERLRAAGIEITVVEDPDVAEQLAPYLHHRRTGRPFVVLKLASTLDGRTAAPDGSSRWITGPEARADVHRLRAESDAVLVGAGTVRADDPALTARDAEGPDPLRVVLGRAPAGARVHPCLELQGDLGEVLDTLGGKGVLQVLVEGGPTVAGAFHRAGLVDRYLLYLAPALLGGDDARPVLAGPAAATIADAWRGRITDVARLGDDLRVTLTGERGLMFTGIVEELGTVLTRTGGRFRFGARAVLEDVTEGASIAVNGVCLTVVEWDTEGGWWEAVAVAETLGRSTLDLLQPGDRVNLERPVRLSDRLGGHLVQGHVDGVGVVVAPAPDLRVTLPGGLGRYVVEKGSITVDGVSLTVVDVTSAADGTETFSVAVIPHTAEVTTLGRRQPGDGVNLEVDVTAKYVERLLTWKA